MSQITDDLQDGVLDTDHINKDSEPDRTTYILSRKSFIHPNNRKMRDEYIERYFGSQIDDENKSSVGVYPKSESEKVKPFDKFSRT